jgi:hypothetical protein
MVLGYPSKKSQNNGSPSAWKICMTIFEFVGQFIFQVDNWACDQSERTWKFPVISYFKDLRQTRGAKNIPKTVLKTRLKIKEVTYTLVFVTYLEASYRKPINKGIISVFERLRIISEIWHAGENIKTDSGSVQ